MFLHSFSKSKRPYPDSGPSIDSLRFDVANFFSWFAASEILEALWIHPWGGMIPRAPTTSSRGGTGALGDVFSTLM